MKRTITINRELYDHAKLYARGLELGVGRLAADVLRPIAWLHKTSVAEVRTAIDFLRNLDRINVIAGWDTRGVILSGSCPLLTPVFIDGLAKRSVEIVSAVMERSKEGRHPFADSPPTNMVMWSNDLVRLNAVQELLADHPKAPRLSNSEKASVYRDATAAQAAAAALLLALRSPATTDLRRRPNEKIRIQPRSVNDARRQLEAATHDLPLLLSRYSPPPVARLELTLAAQKVHAAASRVASLTRPLSNAASPIHASILVDNNDGPDRRGGTYVLVMRLRREQVVRIGRLDTFWLPAGYLLYVGSAFGGGGVKGRTDRHLTPDVAKMWNIDHIKAVAPPIELWWTHHPAKVECQWAMNLASMAGYNCPAPRCGGNDCKACPAHFFHRPDRPSAQDFADQIGKAIRGHSPIYRQLVSRGDRRGIDENRDLEP